VRLTGYDISFINVTLIYFIVKNCKKHYIYLNFFTGPFRNTLKVDLELIDIGKRYFLSQTMIRVN